MEAENKILKFITFKDSKEFEEWQVKNKFSINQVIPIPCTVNSLRLNSFQEAYETEIQIKVFVLYWDVI